MKVIAKYLGGSHLYGLNTPASDIDERGVFVNTEAKYILGLDRFEESRNQVAKEQRDIVYKEVSHFMRLLRQANTEALETLFANESAFSLLTEEMITIRRRANSFVDSERLFSCLKGYMQSEFKLALGERKGQIGGKRYAQLQVHGYSPKNVVQLLRLSYVGKKFFQEDVFVVNMKGEPIYEKLMQIKTQPETFSLEKVKEVYAQAEIDLKEAFETRKFTCVFDEELANQTLLDIYKKHL